MPPMRTRASETPISRYSAGGAPGAGGGTVGGVGRCVRDEDDGGPVGDDLGHRPGELRASRTASR